MPPLTDTSTDLEHVTPLISVVDRWLAERIDDAEMPENLRAAARHAVLGGGKRLRPVLAILCCRAVGGEDDHARAAAVAVELIHAFSLVHDDLPALDNDLLRRGQPTVHAAFGEAMAILAGDALMSLAYETVIEADFGRRDAGHSSALLAELARATRCMINGQVLDTLGGFDRSHRDDTTRLEQVHANKTGALITGACRMGAISGHADSNQLAAITAYGEAVGLMFQIVDDLLDVTQSAEVVGKATNKDQSAGKLTFPGVVGVDASAARVRTLQADATRALDELGGGQIAAMAEPLRSLAAYMAIRTT